MKTLLHMKTLVFRLLSGALACLSLGSVHAQYSADAGASSQDIIDLIEGTGLTISNFTITAGDTTQYGTFSYDADDVLGLDQGLVVTSGYVRDVIGPNYSEGWSYYNEDYTDADITALSSLATYDACVIEFDVVPKCDTLQIDFVFASEEYNEYVCSSFNDAFGFFVSGPGIDGPFSNGAENFARLPDDTGVSIGNVNNGSVGDYGSSDDCGSLANAAYFVDNTSGTDLEPDGFTVPLQAKGVVIPCETYHVKIVIADAGDSAYDSWVFLKSFSCPGQQVAISTPDANADQAQEGCVTGYFELTRSGDTTVALDVDVALGGAATLGTDYTIVDADGNAIGSTVTFEAGEDAIPFYVDAVYDNEDEGEEAITITLGWNVCAQFFEYDTEFVVNDPVVALTCPDDQTVSAGANACSATVTFGEPTADLACGYSVTRTDVTGLGSGSTFPVGTTTLSWELTSDNGNISTSCSTVITVEDVTGPAISCGADVTQNTSGCSAALTVAPASATDACGVASLTNDFTGTADASGTYPVGTTVVTWTATDVHGNTATCTQNVTVSETAAPTITCAADVSASAADACDAAVTVTGPTATDNCGNVTLTNDFTGTADASGTYPVGVTVVTWTATDDAGNTATCTQNVEVTGAFEVPADIDVDADPGACSAVVSNPGPSLSGGSTTSCTTLLFDDFESGYGNWNDGGSDCTRSSSTSFAYNSSYSLRLRDNSSSSVATTDSFDASEYDELSVSFWYITSSFESGEDFWLRISTNGGSSYTTVETWAQGTDFSNNVHYNPTVTIPGPFTSNTVLRLVCDASNNGDKVYFDDISIQGCGAASLPCAPVSVVNDYTGTDDASGTYPAGTTEVTWTYTDANGDTYTATQNVTVGDGDTFAITCSGDMSVSMTGAGCNENVTVTPPTVTGGCGTVTVTNDLTGTSSASGIYTSGATTLTWTATDEDGNQVTCTQTITVVDDQAPTMACQDVTLIIGSDGTASLTTADLDAGTTDNCGLASLTVNPSSFGAGDVGQSGLTATLTATDNAGNVNFCTSSISVQDVTPPAALCSATTLVLNNGGAATLAAEQIDGGCFDNSGSVSLSVSPSSFDCDDLGDQTVTLTATDPSGNTATCTTTVTIEDQEAPVVIAPANVTVDAGASCDASVTVAAASVSDNCGNVTVTNDFNNTSDASGTYPVGVTVITWTATDAGGNTATATSTVTVVDSTDPVIDCTALVEASALVGDGTATVAVPMPSVTDNCTGVTWTNDFTGLPDASGDYPGGTTVVNWTATDAAGNMATCTTTVEVSIVGGPAGVNEGLMLWFDADISALNDGGSLAGDTEEVATCEDLSGNDYDATQPNLLSRPELYLAEANYRPVLAFDGYDDVLPIGGFAQTEDVHQLRAFALFRTEETGGDTDNKAFISFDDSEYWGAYIQGDGALALGYHSGSDQTHVSTTDGYNDNQLRLASFIFDSGALNDTRIRMNGEDVLAVDAVTAATPIGSGATRYGFIGDGSAASSFNGSSTQDFFAGDLAEVICYQGDLTDTQVEQVETYLAIKFGVTVQHDYLNASGTVVRSMGSYHNNVFGLMRDDAGSVDQRQATSADAGAMLAVSTSSLAATNNANSAYISTDGSVLTVGNDGGDMDFSYGYSTDDETHCNRMGRVWHVQATGTESAVQMYIPSSTQATHALLASNPEFTDAVRIEMTVSGNALVFDLPWEDAYLSFTCEKIYAWTGGEDGNWYNGNNWDGGVAPFAGANVEIPSGLAQYPELITDIEVGTMTCQQGASLSYGAARIHVNCNLNHFESSASKTGTFILQGNARQVIDGNDPLYLHNLIIDKQDTAYVSHDTRLSGYVLTNNGVFDFSDVHMTLTSDLSTTGAIARIADGADVLGDSITLQRFFGDGDDNWRMICSPFTDLTYNDWNDDIPTTGFPGSDWPNWPSASNPWVNLYTYNETYTEGWAGHKDIGFEPPADVNDPIDYIQGIFAYWAPDNTMLDVTGVWNRGETQFDLDYTVSEDYGILHDGWNLVANPYPSAIDWDVEEGWEKTNLADAIYVFDPAEGNYHAYVNGIATGNADARIASSQAFWVKAIGPDPSLTINENAKSTAQGVFMRSQDAEIEALVHLEVQGGPWTDDAVFGYLDGAVEGFDPALDAYKMGATNGNMPELSFAMPDDGLLSINMIDIPEESQTIQLFLKPKNHDELTLRNTLVDAMDDNICLSLEDTELNITVPFNMGDEYGFEWSGASTNTRFVLHLSAPLQTTVVDESCPEASNGMLQVDGYGSAPWNITIIGQEAGFSTTFEQVTEPVILEDLLPGSYEIHVVGQDELCPAAMEWVYLEEAPLIEPNLDVQAAPCNQGENGAIHVDLGEDYAWEVKLLNDENFPLQHLYGESGDLSLTGLAAGDYEVDLWSSCGTYHTFEVDLFDYDGTAVYFETVNDFTAHLVGAPVEFTAQAEANSDLTWDFGDGATANGSLNVTHTYERAGLYTVTMVGMGLECLGQYQREVRIVDALEGEEGGPESFGLQSGEELAEELHLDAYGSGNNIYIHAGKEHAEGLTVRLFTVNGKLVYEHTFSELPAGLHELSPSGLTAGLYHLQCTSGEMTLMTRKLLLGE